MLAFEARNLNSLSGADNRNTPFAVKFRSARLLVVGVYSVLLLEDLHALETHNGCSCKFLDVESFAELRKGDVSTGASSL